jgi:hypothetical protein
MFLKVIAYVEEYFYPFFHGDFRPEKFSDNVRHLTERNVLVAVWQTIVSRCVNRTTVD